MSADQAAYLWRPATQRDRPAISAIAAQLHSALPERDSVVTDKLRHGGAACRVLEAAGQPVGYALAHPWRFGDVPPLDAMLPAETGEEDALHLHDVAILPAARGRQLGATYVEICLGLAHEAGRPWLTLASVYGTERLWAVLGFAERPLEMRAAARLRTYGADARYMARRVDVVRV